MYEHILVPTDGSDVALQAATQAVELAAAIGASVHALYVVDASAVGFVRPADLDDDSVRTSLRETGERAVADVAELAEAAGVPVETSVVVGRPAEEIRAAAEGAVDLVVMGTHGRSGVDRFLLGSVTERVVRSSTVPVLAVPTLEGVPVDSEEAAAERAIEAAEADGYEVAGLRDDPYRERTTWVVPVSTVGEGIVNVHIDAASGAARTARIE